MHAVLSGRYSLRGHKEHQKELPYKLMMFSKKRNVDLAGRNGSPEGRTDDLPRLGDDL